MKGPTVPLCSKGCVPRNTLSACVPTFADCCSHRNQTLASTECHGGSVAQVHPCSRGLHPRHPTGQAAAPVLVACTQQQPALLSAKGLLAIRRTSPHIMQHYCKDQGH